jgi:hypothetical protein
MDLGKLLLEALTTLTTLPASVFPFLVSLFRVSFSHPLSLLLCYYPILLYLPFMLPSYHSTFLLVYAALQSFYNRLILLSHCPHLQPFYPSNLLHSHHSIHPSSYYTSSSLHPFEAFHVYVCVYDVLAIP